MGRIDDLRRGYHAQIGSRVVSWSKKGKQAYPNFAEGNSNSSMAIALRLCEKLRWKAGRASMGRQTAGRLFEEITRDYIQAAFEELKHLRPGEWIYYAHQTRLWEFFQYRHLQRVKELVDEDRKLTALLGLDYFIAPDIVVARSPEPESAINQGKLVVERQSYGNAGLTPLREINQPEKAVPLMHAMISCKWTIRSDRSQNVRTEALTLIRNRKGPLPHIVAVTAEPLPTRIASLALGTGELDCVYHIALAELEEACQETQLEDQIEVLADLVQGSRLRDISDLPFDLAI